MTTASPAPSTATSSGRRHDVGERDTAPVAGPSLHDPLTDLANRALFADRPRQTPARHARNRQPSALLYCDLDDFKQVNDTLGHCDRDELLRTVTPRHPET
jgi:diguanylate cyclase (GGDEF)-like protein